jgi:hypothetical protein
MQYDCGHSGGAGEGVDGQAGDALAGTRFDQGGGRLKFLRELSRRCLLELFSDFFSRWRGGEEGRVVKLEFRAVTKGTALETVLTRKFSGRSRIV